MIILDLLSCSYLVVTNLRTIFPFFFCPTNSPKPTNLIMTFKIMFNKEKHQTFTFKSLGQIFASSKLINN